jgi:hypothetical protein
MTMGTRRKLILAAFLTVGSLTLAADVLAIVGRPATPVSYAGVARRSVRRNVYY